MPVCALGRGVCGGALYTGRGPVCGTIIRRIGGGAALTAGGAAGFGGVATGGAGGTVAAGTGGAFSSVVAGGAAATGGRGGAAASAGGAGGAGGTGGGCTGAGGRGCGTINLGCGCGGAAGGVAFGGAGADAAGAAGFFSTGAGGADGRDGVATGAACCLLISFRTSPGLEIWDRSILVLIRSVSARLGRAPLDALCASAAARKCARTFSASCSSIELECVFFSVTPTSCRTSRIALLLTSSSLARSLIRILLIRPSVPSTCPVKPS